MPSSQLKAEKELSVSMSLKVTMPELVGNEAVPEQRILTDEDETLSDKQKMVQAQKFANFVSTHRTNQLTEEERL